MSIGAFYTHLQLVQSETSSCPDFGVVPDRLAVNDGSEETGDGSGSDSLGLLHSLCPPPLLLACLVEPRLDIPEGGRGA